MVSTDTVCDDDDEYELSADNVYTVFVFYSISTHGNLQCVLLML